jgi:hypothetical protein
LFYLHQKVIDSSKSISNFLGLNLSGYKDYECIIITYLTTTSHEN